MKPTNLSNSINTLKLKPNHFFIPDIQENYEIDENTKMKTHVQLIIATFIIVSFAQFTLAESESKNVIHYKDYGAVGDGVTDDFDAIIKAHNAANEAGSRVSADPGATYYIGGADKIATIQTDTYWGDAKFIIDDTKVENRNRHIFVISSKLPTERITTIKTLAKNQVKLDLSLSHESFIVVTDRNTKRYIRLGLNQNNGSDQTDAFVVDKNGNVDGKAPIIWNFDNITSMTAYPIDSMTLTIRGGHFTTIANQAESRYTYYSRGINVTRSNVIIDGVTHNVTEELDHGAPYGGFISISNCADVIVLNCRPSGHKTYSTIGSANAPVSMGSYDISVTRSINVTIKNCKQLNDIHDTKLWGVFTSNYSKNITFDTVEFSRFDAHMGVANATIKNSVLGHQGMNIIGCGVFLIENTKVCGSNFISLRGDYGSTFEGEFIIRNCEYAPRNGAQADAVLIGGNNSGQHDFGYPCYMPEKITIDGLVINDANPPRNYAGPKIFAPFNNDFKSDDYVEKFPYTITKEIGIKNLTVKSDKPWIISNNKFLFRNVIITETQDEK